MDENANLVFLDISKNKELSDEGSLVVLAQKLKYNTHLQTLDLSQVRVRKPFFKLHMEPSLQFNIFLKYVISQPAPEPIEEHLLTNIIIQQEVLPRFHP